MESETTLLIIIGVPIGLWLVIAIIRKLRGDSVIIDGRTYHIDSKGNFSGRIDE